MRHVSWMPVVLAALLLALPASSQVPPPLTWVDLGVRELGLRAQLVSSRTDEDVWLIASGRGSSSQVLRSADAGRSWQVDTKASRALERALIASSHVTIDHLVWVTPEIGIAAGYLGARVLRTTDAGLSWQAIPLTDNPWVYEVERAGKRVWLCGSSGHILRSDDAGASWQELKGSPFNSDDRCMEMSFLSPESGWAVGMHGSLWATEDGGTSWQRLSAPEQAPLRDDPSSLPPELRHVVRLTALVAWVQGSGGRFLTTDGGKTWHSKPTAQSEKDAVLAVSRTPGGQQVVTVGPAGDGVPVEQWVPFLGESEGVAPLGENTVVALGQRGLSTFVSGQLLRAGPPVGKGSDVLTPLEGIARKAPDAWLGWVGEQIVASHDEGRTWFRVGRVPQSPLRALAFLKEDTVLAESGAGTLLRSDDFGRTWAPSTSPLDAYDFALASGRTASAESPFDCVLTTSPASMKVRFDIQGCFDSYTGVISVKLSPDRAELSGERTVEKPFELERRTISRGEGERIVRELVAAATRQETPLGCDSTTWYTATIEWSCPSGRIKKGTVELRAPGCGALTRGTATTTGSAAPDGYARALGIHQVTSEVFAGASH
ncbi:hypothetical protein [Vitiosangium sp. GDMCC 1.1324]|uniref:WD40/YVTN/BNR-like repeat-containing protein n=1 Tax=Vitiosangium sp. (strain GDMCC 1.1324) TaxID=2138576 RepID=UPI000D36AB24|nr:hypothetical protein [Vitiosangium sp. GDMCC 1.1324]PTL75962.1 hypothetical protein DAT35_51455 [Vitiosangium sp. GDMCC 1.1324]